jgi:predicted RNase H-like HicB family nuclease
MQKFLVIIEKTDTGFSAYVPDLPGCIATADTREGLKANIFEAIRFHLDGLRAEGFAIPESKSEADIVSIAI